MVAEREVLEPYESLLPLYVSRVERESAASLAELSAHADRISKDAALFIDCERFPVNTELAPNDTQQLLQSLNDYAAHAMPRFTPLDTFVCHLEASRLRSRRHIMEFFDQGDQQRNELISAGHLDRLLDGPRIAWELMKSVYPELHPVFNDKIVEDLAGDGTALMEWCMANDYEAMLKMAGEYSRSQVGASSGAMTADRQTVRPASGTKEKPSSAVGCVMVLVVLAVVLVGVWIVGAILFALIDAGF